MSSWTCNFCNDYEIEVNAFLAIIADIMHKSQFIITKVVFVHDILISNGNAFLDAKAGILASYD